MWHDPGHSIRSNGMRIATCPVNWNNNDIPGWRSVTPYPVILDLMVEAGYRATEYDASFGSDIDDLRRQADQRDLSWSGSYRWVNFLDSPDVDKAITSLVPTLELLDAIDCRNLIVSDSLRPHRVAMAGRVPSDGSASLDEQAVEKIADGIHHLARLADEYGIRVHYHNHVGTWIEAPHELNALLDHLDTSIVDLCFDTGHYAYGGGNPAEFIARNLATIGYLHLKDVDTGAVADARDRQLTFIEALREIVFCPIGKGSADIPAILDVLSSHHFRGWIIVEQDTCLGNPTEVARRNLDFISSWISNHAACR